MLKTITVIVLVNLAGKAIDLLFDLTIGRSIKTLGTFSQLKERMDGYENLGESNGF